MSIKELRQLLKRPEENVSPESIKKEIIKKIPEFERFKFNIKVNNREVRVIGEEGSECWADIENKNIPEIVNDLEPCLKDIIKRYTSK